MRVGDICRVINPKRANIGSVFDYYNKLVILVRVDSLKAEHKRFGVLKLDDGIYQSWFDEDELELVKEIDGETALKLFKLDMVKELEIDKQDISALK